MRVEVNFPKAGMGIEEGTIAKWHKRAGERVKSDELLVEIETAKAIQDVVAPATGIISAILIEEGETVPVNTILATIEV